MKNRAYCYSCRKSWLPWMTRVSLRSGSVIQSRNASLLKNTRKSWRKDGNWLLFLLKKETLFERTDRHISCVKRPSGCAYNGTSSLKIMMPCRSSWIASFDSQSQLMKNLTPSGCFLAKSVNINSRSSTHATNDVMGQIKERVFGKCVKKLHH